MKLSLLLTGDLTPGCTTIDVAMGLEKAGVEVTLDPHIVMGGLPMSFLPLLNRSAEGKNFDVGLGVDDIPALTKTSIVWADRDLTEYSKDIDLMLTTHPVLGDRPPSRASRGILPFGYDPEVFKPRTRGQEVRPLTVMADPEDPQLPFIMEDLAGSGVPVEWKALDRRSYLAADVLLLQEWQTGTPSTSALEFMATGGVVMAPARGHYLGWFSPDIAVERPPLASNVTALILQLAHTPGEVAMKGSAAAARVAAEFAWPVVIQKLLREITRVL